MHQFIVLILAGLLATSTGCAATSMRSAEYVPWQTSPDQLGRIALFIDLDDVGPERLREEKEREINDILLTTFEPLQASTILEGAAIRKSLNGTAWTRASDYELIMAARKHDMDAIALVHVDRYVGELAIGLLPLPGWSARTDVTYRLRVLDAETGQVLADVQRHRKTGGYLGYSRRAYLARDFQDDLADVLTMASHVQ